MLDLVQGITPGPLAQQKPDVLGEGPFAVNPGYYTSASVPSLPNLFRFLASPSAGGIRRVSARAWGSHAPEPIECQLERFRALWPESSTPVQGRYQVFERSIASPCKLRPSILPTIRLPAAAGEVTPTGLSAVEQSR